MVEIQFENQKGCSLNGDVPYIEVFPNGYFTVVNS